MQSRNKVYLTNLKAKVEHKQLVDSLRINDEYTDLTEAIIIPEKQHTILDRMIQDKRTEIKFKKWQFKRWYSETNRFIEGKINIPFVMTIVLILGVFAYFYISASMVHNQSPIATPVVVGTYNNVASTPTPVVVMIDKPKVMVKDKPNVDDKFPEVLSITPNPAITITPIPKPVLLPVNAPHLDQNDFIDQSGLNSNYALTPNQHIKGWSNYTFNLKLQSLSDTPAHNINIVVTACQYTFDGVNNRPNLGNAYTLYNDNVGVDMKKYDIVTYDKSVYIPNYTGQYVLIVNLYADNGAYIKINQLITIGG